MRLKTIWHCIHIGVVSLALDIHEVTRVALPKHVGWVSLLQFKVGLATRLLCSCCRYVLRWSELSAPAAHSKQLRSRVPWIMYKWRHCCFSHFIVVNACQFREEFHWNSSYLEHISKIARKMYINIYQFQIYVLDNVYVFLIKNV